MQSKGNIQKIHKKTAKLLTLISFYEIFTQLIQARAIQNSGK